MTYFYFSLLIQGGPEALRELTDQHRRVAEAHGLPLCEYELDGDYLSIKPPWQEESEDLYAGGRILLNEHYVKFFIGETRLTDDFHMRIDVYHDGQCNLQMPGDLLGLIGSVYKMDVALSCYECEELVEEMTELLERTGKA